jgi:outer membrane lipoprotein-sorting protein
MRPMRIFQSHPALRWVVPAVAAAVIGGTSLIAVSASADPALPPRTPEQLLVDLQKSTVDEFSGTVVQKSNLGLPELPGLSNNQYDTSLTSLISGTHTLQVWSAGPDKQRLAVHGTLGETDVIRNGKDVWNWSSRENAATHMTLSSDHAAEPTPSEVPATPREAADRILQAIQPSTKVTTDRALEVAGRPAYALVLEPKDSGSLIGQVRIAVDGEHKVPLGVQVIATDGTVVFDTSFTSVSFTRPDGANFTFNPPPGTTVTEKKPPEHDTSTGKESKSDQPKPTVVGEGWSAVMVTKVDPAQLQQGSKNSTDNKGNSVDKIIAALPKVSGPWGSGHLLSSNAFSLVITTDGRIAAGAVAPDRLYQALS